MLDDGQTKRLNYEDKEVTLIGTAHVSRESTQLVQKVISETRPETVCVELCESRYTAMTQKNRWQDTDLLKVIREKKAFLLLSNLILAYFQKKIGEKLDIKPGAEILQAINSAEEVGARIHLADRDIRTTLSRAWRLMGMWTKLKLLFQLTTSIGDMGDITEKEIEEMKKKDVLEALLSEMGQSLPEIRRILIDERDQYLAHRIRNAPGNRIVAVVGAGHVPGIQHYWNEPIDTDALNQVPPQGKAIRVLKWGIPILILGIFVFGFIAADAATGVHVIKWWILANATLAGLGAACALAHPLTILAAILASPLTSLNPMVAAGWVAGLVEILMGKPKVRDFEALADDIGSLKGFWRNKITRILLVVVFTNLGSSLGTFVAIPLMVKVLA